MGRPFFLFWLETSCKRKKFKISNKNLIYKSKKSRIDISTLKITNSLVIPPKHPFTL